MAMMKLHNWIRRENDGAPGDPPAVPPTGDQTPPATPSAPAPNDNISLSKAEYGQLMGTIAALQAQLQPKDEPPEPAPNPDDLDKLTNSQLMQIMLDQVQKQVGQPLLNSIMTLAVKEELREVERSHPDFKDMKDDVYKEAQTNTHLSLEQAYLIVKARKTGQTPPPTPPAPGKTPPAPPLGEKPGVTVSSTTGNGQLSIKEAAEAALKSLQYSDS